MTTETHHSPKPSLSPLLVQEKGKVTIGEAAFLTHHSYQGSRASRLRSSDTVAADMRARMTRHVYMPCEARGESPGKAKPGPPKRSSPCHPGVFAEPDARCSRPPGDSRVAGRAGNSATAPGDSAAGWTPAARQIPASDPKARTGTSSFTILRLWMMCISRN